MEQQSFNLIQNIDIATLLMLAAIFVTMLTQNRSTNKQIFDLSQHITDLRVDVGHLKSGLNLIDKRFDHLEKGIDQLEKRIDQLEKRIDQLEKRIDQLEKRFDKLEAEFNKFNGTINNKIEERVAIETIKSKDEIKVVLNQELHTIKDDTKEVKVIKEKINHIEENIKSLKEETKTNTSDHKDWSTKAFDFMQNLTQHFSPKESTNTVPTT